MTDQALQAIILEEVRALRTRFDVHSADTGARLSVLETHMESLIGDHQPGRLTVVEKKVSELQQWRWRIAGIASTIGAGSAIVLHFWK